MVDEKFRSFQVTLVSFFSHFCIFFATECEEDKKDYELSISCTILEGRPAPLPTPSPPPLPLWHPFLFGFTCTFAGFMMRGR